MTNFFAVRMPPGEGGDEFVGLLNKLDSRYRVSSDTEKLTKFLRSAPDSTEIRFPQGILAFEKMKGVQRLAAGRDSSVQLNSIGMEPFVTQGTSPLLQDHVTVGRSAMNPNFSLLSREPGALNAVDILMGTESEYSSNVTWSSGDTSMDSVVKKEDPEEKYRPLFTLNPLPQQEPHTLFKEADALVKDEFDEDGCQDSGVMEGLVKEEEMDDEFGASEDHEDEYRKKLANQGVPDDLSTAFLVRGLFHQCKICNACFPFADVTKHWQSHPRCSYCRLRFRNREVLADHKHIHTRCDICGGSFPTPSLLKVHRRSHMGENPFECEVCQKRFTSNSPLIVHMRTHTGENPFKCTECKKSFNQKGNLMVHQRSHTGEKPFACEVCQIRFAHKSTLTGHLAIHTGEKPFECLDCQKRFTSSSALGKHRRRVHRLQKTSG